MLCAETGKKHPLVNCYRFYLKKVEISPSNGETFCIPYTHFNHILEYQNLLFLFADNKNTFILDPSSMTKGNEKNLKTFLNQKLKENLITE